MIESFDLLVVGGGINGVGIARSAVGRGLSVCLCERDDLAAHTSSASTKLIHGGLRYLEQGEFSLVSKALVEREVLLRQAPHIVWPMRFVLPHQKHLRPAWMIRAGLFFYDHLGRGRRTLPGSRRINLKRHVVGAPLRGDYRTGFVYSDAWVQDARLVVLNAMDARDRGARILPRTQCVSARRINGSWEAHLQSTSDDVSTTIRAKALINATGPWAVQFLDEIVQVEHKHALQMVKGSHIVVPRLFTHDHAYIFQQPDRRIVFVIPYEHDFSLIGTTDISYHDDPATPRIDESEIHYLCAAVNRYFQHQITPDDVVWSYSGVRPLLDDQSCNPSQVTRDYLLELDTQGAPLLSVFGGKLTTYRKLAEQALDRLMPLFPWALPAWTHQAPPLPGGERINMDAYRRELQSHYPWLPQSMAWRLAYNYGTRSACILRKARSLADLGTCYGADLYQAEVDYLREQEWVMNAEDILWRRSKLGLRIDHEGVARLQANLRGDTGQYSAENDDFATSNQECSAHALSRVGTSV